MSNHFWPFPPFFSYTMYLMYSSWLHESFFFFWLISSDHRTCVYRVEAIKVEFYVLCIMFVLLFLFRFSDWTLLFWFGVSVIIWFGYFFLFSSFVPVRLPLFRFLLSLSPMIILWAPSNYSIWKFKLFSSVRYSATCLFICHIVQLRPKYFLFIWLSFLFTQIHHLINKNNRIKLVFVFNLTFKWMLSSFRKRNINGRNYPFEKFTFDFDSTKFPLSFRLLVSLSHSLQRLCCNQFLSNWFICWNSDSNACFLRSFFLWPAALQRTKIKFFFFTILYTVHSVHRTSFILLRLTFSFNQIVRNG